MYPCITSADSNVEQKIKEIYAEAATEYIMKVMEVNNEGLLPEVFKDHLIKTLKKKMKYT